MKKLIYLTGAIGLALALTGCSDNNADSSKVNAADKNTNFTNEFAINNAVFTNINNINTKLVTDPKTGVEYIEVYVNKEKGGGVSVTPRLDKNGRPYINPKWRK